MRGEVSASDVWTGTYYMVRMIIPYIPACGIMSLG
jgi:hypothetical protein